jgi:hypothetical protein
MKSASILQIDAGKISWRIIVSHILGFALTDIETELLGPESKGVGGLKGCANQIDWIKTVWQHLPGALDSVVPTRSALTVSLGPDSSESSGDRSGRASTPIRGNGAGDNPCTDQTGVPGVRSCNRAERYCAI